MFNCPEPLTPIEIYDGSFMVVGDFESDSREKDFKVIRTAVIIMLSAFVIQ